MKGAALVLRCSDGHDGAVVACQSGAQGLLGNAGRPALPHLAGQQIPAGTEAGEELAHDSALAPHVPPHLGRSNIEGLHQVLTRSEISTAAVQGPGASSHSHRAGHETSRSRKPSLRAAGLPPKLRRSEPSAVLPKEAVLGAGLLVACAAPCCHLETTPAGQSHHELPPAHLVRSV